MPFYLFVVGIILENFDFQLGQTVGFCLSAEFPPPVPRVLGDFVVVIVV